MYTYTHINTFPNTVVKFIYYKLNSKLPFAELSDYIHVCKRGEKINEKNVGGNNGIERQNFSIRFNDVVIVIDRASNGRYS
jgi:hypothetical protein